MGLGFPISSGCCDANASGKMRHSRVTAPSHTRKVTVTHVVENAIDLSGAFAADLHSLLRDAVEQGPLASDVSTGATVVLRQRDVEALAYDQRLEGIGLALFDMMGITDGCLRDWYGSLMFTTEGDYHRRIRSLVSRAFTRFVQDPAHGAAALTGFWETLG